MRDVLRLDLLEEEQVVEDAVFPPEMGQHFCIEISDLSKDLSLRAANIWIDHSKNRVIVAGLYQRPHTRDDELESINFIALTVSKGLGQEKFWLEAIPDE